MLGSIRTDHLLAVFAPGMITTRERTRHLVEMIVVVLVHKCKPAAPSSYQHSITVIRQRALTCDSVPGRTTLPSPALPRLHTAPPLHPNAGLKHPKSLERSFVNRLPQGQIRKHIREGFAFFRSAMHNGQNTGNRRSLILAQTCPVMQDIHNQCWHGSR